MFAVVMAIQVIGIAALVGEIVYLFTRPASRLQLTLLLMCLCVFVNFTGETAEILSTTPDAALTAVRMSYLGKPFIVFSCLLFIADYCRVHMRRWLLCVLCAIQASVSIMAFTCPWHALYYTSIGWTESGLFPHLVLGKSPLYLAYSAFIGMYLVLFAVLIIRQLRRSDTSAQRRQACNLLIIVIVMAASLGVYLSGVTEGYDCTLVGYALSVILLVHTIMRYNLFETITLARERAIQDSEDGLAVLDQRGDLIFLNTTAAHVLGTQPHSADAPTLDYYDPQMRLLIDRLEDLAQQEAPVTMGDHYYRTRLRELVQNEVPYGRIFELKDVTESYTYSTRLEHDVEEKTQEIRRIQRDVIVGFANMVEERDGVTGSHIKNTSTYVNILTCSLQNMIHELAADDPAQVKALWGPGYADALDPDFRAMVVEVAPLHDLGKIAVSDAILCKPGRLTAEEFQIMQTHAVKGAEIIESTLRDIETDDYVQMAKQVALWHHEKWNGSGYPEGLAGAEIPLSARIMAVADVYDALLSPRSYKESFSPERARAIIEADAGKHFDPVLVEAFVRAIDEMEAVRN